MESQIAKPSKPVRRAFLLGILSALVLMSAWDAVPHSGEHWIIKLVVFGGYIFHWFVLSALVFKFFSTIWKWLNR